ncbi:MAG TPA: hypothetical protein DD979_09010 [Gammaproteobacteria bacterium]|jgi:hypothetical protein|nr:hypothetical protein [Gammaproteobacteria bacterium]
MSYDDAVNTLLQEPGVNASTMMNSPCLRYHDAFIAMRFEKEDALIIKVSSERVQDLIAEGTGRPFNFTKKTFKEWVLIPPAYEADYENYIREAIAYAKQS